MNKETLNKIKYLAGMAAHLPADVTLEDEDAALKALHGELAADTVLELIALAERTTSPVSQMTAHLAAIEEALKVMRDNGLDECYAFENAIEALAFMKEVAK